MRKSHVTSVILVLAALIVTAPGWAAPKPSPVSRA